MDHAVTLVTDVLQELRIDLQDFLWLVAEQLHIDQPIQRVTDQVYIY